jgi:hypothetical protein
MKRRPTNTHLNTSTLHSKGLKFQIQKLENGRRIEGNSSCAYIKSEITKSPEFGKGKIVDMRPNIAVHQSNNFVARQPTSCINSNFDQVSFFSFLSTAKLNRVTLHNYRLQHQWAVSPSDPLSNQLPHNNPLLNPTNLPSYIPLIAPPPQRAPPQALQILSLPLPPCFIGIHRSLPLHPGDSPEPICLGGTHLSPTILTPSPSLFHINRETRDLGPSICKSWFEISQRDSNDLDPHACFGRKWVIEEGKDFVLARQK